MVKWIERFARDSALSQGPRERRQIAITFDDGPHPEWTPRVLDALDRAEAKATFFVVGRNALAHPELVLETRRRGHEIGTHLFWHRRDTVFDDELFENELRQSREFLEPLLGERLKWLRFPYGVRGKQRTRAVFEKHGLRSVHWSFSSHDSRATTTEIVTRVAAGLRPGVIVLMHDALSDAAEVTPPYVAGRACTVAALGPIGELLAQRKLSAVTLSTLFQDRERASERERSRSKKSR